MKPVQNPTNSELGFHAPHWSVLSECMTVLSESMTDNSKNHEPQLSAAYLESMTQDTAEKKTLLLFQLGTPEDFVVGYLRSMSDINKSMQHLSELQNITDCEHFRVLQKQLHGIQTSLVTYQRLLQSQRNMMAGDNREHYEEHGDEHSKEHDDGDGLDAIHARLDTFID